MILYEFEVKDLLEKHGVPVEKSCLAESPGDVNRCLEAVPGPPYVVKAQVRRWGRGKAGLVRIAETALSAEKEAEELIMETGRVMISQYIRHERELYLAFLLDGTERTITLLASTSGGVNVEENTENVLRIRFSALEDVMPYMKRLVSKRLEVPLEQISPLLDKLYTVFRKYGFMLLEVNPLAVTESGLVVIDRKAVADDDAVRRVLPEFWKRYLEELPQVQREALEAGISLVLLEGDIAVIGNGAGLTMATMDLVKYYGGSPGLFIDIGGGASSERVRKALQLTLKTRDFKSIIVNILGGITRCDDVARGLVSVVEENPDAASRFFVRLAGLNEEEGRMLLREAGIKVYSDPLNAVVEAIHHANTGR